eukprot:scaffold2751_cov266-Pinguiococcus_pyrenoidosus.AAC.3
MYAEERVFVQLAEVHKIRQLGRREDVAGSRIGSVVDVHICGLLQAIVRHRAASQSRRCSNLKKTRSAPGYQGASKRCDLRSDGGCAHAVHGFTDAPQAVQVDGMVCDSLGKLLAVLDPLRKEVDHRRPQGFAVPHQDGQKTRAVRRSKASRELRIQNQACRVRAEEADDQPECHQRHSSMQLSNVALQQGLQCSEVPETPFAQRLGGQLDLAGRPSARRHYSSAD